MKRAAVAAAVVLLFTAACTSTPAPVSPPASATTAPPVVTATPTAAAMAATVTPTITRTATATARPSATPSPTATPTRTATPIPTLTPVSVVQKSAISPPDLAGLLLNPQAGIVTRSRFFTSACFGPNPLQKEDFLRPLDWQVSKREMGPSNFCIYGFNPGADGQPRGFYWAGQHDGLPLHYIIPPAAFDQTEGRLVLSEVSLIVDPAPHAGWESLGFIVISANGVNYKGWAADVLRPGGTLRSIDGTKTIRLPADPNIVSEPDDDGSYGFAGFPLLIADKGLTFGYTGSPVNGPPPRVYFTVRVDELDPRVNVATTAEMSNQELGDLAHEFDRRLAGRDRIAMLSSLEKSVPVNDVKINQKPKAEVDKSPSESDAEVNLKPRDEVLFQFSSPPGAILSSIHLFMWPQNNHHRKEILEINPNLYINGRVMFPGTGFEDFGGGAFYEGGKNPLGAFFHIDRDGYLAMRYFMTGPVIPDGRVDVRLKNPDIGAAIKLRVEVRVIAPNSTLR